MYCDRQRLLLLRLFITFFQLSCDSDANVRYGAELLDRLMKDIVSENPHFDIDNFIFLLRSRVYTKEAYARQFLVSWVRMGVVSLQEF